MTRMSNNILRTEKVKSRAQITQAAEHNFRLRTQSNIDASRTHLNKILINTLDVDVTVANDLQNKLSDFYSNLGIKEKKDNVLMMEFVVSASPEFFTGKKMSQIEEWAKNQVDFFKNEFGDQVKIAVLHLDEKTPHLHFMIGTEVKSVKKYKNQKGECFKETWSLNAKRYNPEFLIGLHDRHAICNNKYKLKRGVRGSMRKHKTLKEFYGMIDKALGADYENQIQEIIDNFETGFLLNKDKVSVDEVREKFSPLINKMLKQTKALREKYKFDIQEFQEYLVSMQSKIIEERDELSSRREVYRDAINRAMNDAKLIDELQNENFDLKKQLEKYKPDIFKDGSNGKNRNNIRRKI